MFNVDPELCYDPIKMSGQATVRFRHVAKEPEIVTLSVASTDASAGAYTIATRNGNRGAEGAAALAVLEGLTANPTSSTPSTKGSPSKRLSATWPMSRANAGGCGIKSKAAAASSSPTRWTTTAN